MSGISKRVSGSWVSGNYGIMKTSTDTITTLPADLYADGTNATVGLKGNMVQNGTPTPDNPIMPQGCGDRTENLTPNQKITSNTYSHTITTHPLINALKNITPNENYTLSWEFSSNGSGGVSNQIRLYTRASGTLIKILQQGVSFTLTSEEIANIGALFCYFGVSNTDGYMDKLMLVEGSTAPSTYIPYGYKIPISSANTTTPVYLGEVQTTRRIKKLVLTGEEDSWNKSGAYQGSFYLAGGAADAVSLSYQAYCSHAAFTTLDQYTRNTFCFNGSPINLNLWIGESSWTTDDFKTYLQQQYAAGTPVTVWYVLATEETAVVNEPLMKIGDYADEVSNVSIPTITGKDTFDVDTTLKPSEASLNYTGWHNATVKEWNGSQWNE